MTTGLPKQPTIGSILAGIGLVVLAFLAFLRLPDVVKFSGAVLMFAPARLGLIDMVTPKDVIAFPLTENPSTITIPSPGRYLLYVNNYELLVVHDAVVEGNSDPWIKIQPENLDSQVELSLIGRGLAWYDTPFVPGRPVVTFHIDRPGTYRIVHPVRPDIANIVPDTITGKESWITFWVLVELILIGGAVYFSVRKRSATRRRQRLKLQAENRARVEDTWRRIEKKAEDKRKEEDLPYWKKH